MTEKGSNSSNILIFKERPIFFLNWKGWTKGASIPGEVTSICTPSGYHYKSAKFFIKRKDDNLETIMSRYDIYTNTTKPVLNFLSKNPNFHEIDGTLEIDEITRKIDTFIDV